MAEKPLKILELTFEELTDELRFRYGKGTFHAAAIFRQIYRRANADIGRMDEFSQSPELAEKLREDLDFTLYPVIEQKTQTGLLKFVTRLKDGLEIESVIVPMAHHKTLCISSQVGCRMGCAFCETAQLGFLRNLSVEEIVGQAYRAKVIFGFDIKNLVFMGMGEPFDNLDNVVQAIRVMNDQRGLDFARRHITVSTVGIPGGFRKLAALNWPDLKLAVSLNAPNDRIRSQIMPVNHLVPMESLKQTLLSYPLKKKAAFFIEYVLIKFLNDSREHARELAEFLRPLNTKVNIIPFNPRSGSSFTPPSDDDVQLFCNWLAEENVFVRKRSVKGQNMMAACGQLGNRELKRGKKNEKPRTYS